VGQIKEDKSQFGIDAAILFLLLQIVLIDETSIQSNFERLSLSPDQPIARLVGKTNASDFVAS
jgi:hypothetical protein